jgi:hypothetical protein
VALEAGAPKLNYPVMIKASNKEGGLSLIGFIALCQSRSSKTKRGISRHPASVLAPESALGSLPSVALSSAQADLILCELEKHACFIRKQRSKNPRPASLEMAGFGWPQMAAFGVATEDLGIKALISGSKH